VQCLETYSSGKDEEFVNWVVAFLAVPIKMGSRSEAWWM
jgi:hypothetical protein